MLNHRVSHPQQRIGLDVNICICLDKPTDSVANPYVGTCPTRRNRPDGSHNTIVHRVHRTAVRFRNIYSVVKMIRAQGVPEFPEGARDWVCRCEGSDGPTVRCGVSLPEERRLIDGRREESKYGQMSGDVHVGGAWNGIP